MRTKVEMIHLPLQCTHMEGLSFSGMKHSRQFPHTTNSESGLSWLHLWQRDSKASHNWLLYASHIPWPLPDHLCELSPCSIVCQRWCTTLFQKWLTSPQICSFRSNQLIMGSISLPATSKHMLYRTITIFWLVNAIPSTMPEAQACIHPPHLRQSQLPAIHTVGVILTYVIIVLSPLVL